MESCPAIWNVLHDAIVVDLEGQLPGSVRLEIECDYLRDRIDHPGNRFYITLSSCTKFTYRPWAEDAPVIHDFKTLSGRRLWILSADIAGGFCRVHCKEHIPNGSGGSLEIAARSATLTLDGGKPFTVSELETAAEEYWAEWQASSKEL
jgi:hypothetical protein